MDISKLEFKDFYKEKPIIEGFYVWRVPHNQMKDLSIVFISKFRKRGAGYKDILSPDFDHWDGYKILLPKKIEWSDPVLDKPRNDDEILYIQWIKLQKCPFCKTSPKFIFDGRFIGATPIDSEYFSLRCCDWINHSRFFDPRKLAHQWNDAILGKTKDIK